MKDLDQETVDKICRGNAIKLLLARPARLIRP